MATVRHKLLTDANLHVPGYTGASDPGAVGAGIYWVDTTAGTGSWVLKVRNATDTGWETVGSGGSGPATLDDLPDGTTYERVLATQLGSGKLERTTNNVFYIGDGTNAANKELLNSNGDANAPRLRYNETDNVWEYSNNGTTFNRFVDPTGSLVFLIDGGGVALTTGIKGDVRVPYACTITGVYLLADQTGSVVIDLWKDTYANFPPTDADSITASAPPTISSATKSEDLTLTGWTVSVSAGDIIRFNVDSCSSITRCTIALLITRS